MNRIRLSFCSSVGIKELYREPSGGDKDLPLCYRHRRFNMPSDACDRDSKFFQSLPPDFIIGDDPAQRRLFREYGAVFVARSGVTPPSKVVFQDEQDVAEFQSGLQIASSGIGGFILE